MIGKRIVAIAMVAVALLGFCMVAGAVMPASASINESSGLTTWYGLSIFDIALLAIGIIVALVGLIMGFGLAAVLAGIVLVVAAIVANALGY